MTIQHVLLLALSLLMLNACDKAPVTWQESVQKAIEENRTLAKEDFTQGSSLCLTLMVGRNIFAI